MSDEGLRVLARDTANVFFAGIRDRGDEPFMATTLLMAMIGTVMAEELGGSPEAIEMVLAKVRDTMESVVERQRVS